MIHQDDQIHALIRAFPRPVYTRLNSPEYPESVRRRIVHLSEVNDAGCWVWRGNKNEKGYGKVQIGRSNRWAHRVSYLSFIDDRPIADGHTIDHLCRNRACVNPFHLEPVPHGENVRRGNTGITWRRRTHCNHGHEFTPENTRKRHDCNGRVCRTCKRESNERQKAKRRAEKNS